MLDQASTNFIAELAASGVAPMHELTPSEARQAGERMVELYGAGPAMVRVQEFEVPTADGDRITVRVLVPHEEVRGVIVYYHGGGWVLGALDQFDTLARLLAQRTDCAVALVDYRLAPEHPYPAAIEDAWAALAWIAANLDQIAEDDVPLIVAGDSAGGNLAAVVSQRARVGGPEIALQVLVYPVTDCDFDTGSYGDPANQLIVSRETMMWFWDHYAPDRSVRTSSDASPLRAASLAGLPPAVIVTAEHDVLRDEGEEYARRLGEHGVRVEHRRFEAQMHGFFMMVGLVPGSAAGLDFVARAITRELAGSGHSAPAERPVSEFDAIVVGAGFAGLYALHRLREMGLSVRVFEQGNGVGGTWYWNRYPGVRCDIESVDYSYSFSEELEQEWEWSERYPTGPEILRYRNHVADRFNLRPDIQLGTRVTQAHYNDAEGRWQLVTGDGARFSARYCVMASGCLSSVHRPEFVGLDKFGGDWYHTARWPQGVELAGKRVGVIGTGSTGIQLIPQLAKQAKHLHVFQRTANFSMPAHNAPLDPELQRAIKAGYRERRRLSRESLSGVPRSHPDAIPQRSALGVGAEERERIYEQGWAQGGIAGVLLAFNDINTNSDANRTAADFVRAKIRQTVRDPTTAEALCPTTHPIGTKRICVDIDYYATYNRDDVTLIDVRRDPIVEITRRGIRTSHAEFDLDVIVFATGFDAITGALLEIDIHGRDGRALRDKWSGGPRTYLGLATAGFPNMFLVTGPGSPSVLSNMVCSIEQHVDWIADCIANLREHGLETIEATPEAEEDWIDHVAEVAEATLFPQANSWYVGANIPGKPRVFMPYLGGVGNYRTHCESVAANGYEGFLIGGELVGARS
jgi:cation diffusion facilitator CzcD-associated flavoprotein CzcO/acetyl esterase/lipase